MKPVAAALVLALGACTRQDVESAGNALASSAPRVASDALIVTSVEAKLFSIDADSALHVAVAAQGGDVRLSGKVRDAGTLRRFVAAAGGVRGVRHVAVQLAPDAHLPHVRDRLSDFGVVAGVRARIAGQAGVDGLKVSVSARAGTVTLGGKVATRELQAKIVEAARGAPGVKTVVAHLEVAR